MTVTTTSKQLNKITEKTVDVYGFIILIKKY